MKRLLLTGLLWCANALGATAGHVVCHGQNPCEPIGNPQVTIPIDSTQKFVDCSLATNGNGTFASPWNRISNVTGMASGNDLWLKAGTVCANQMLSVNWSGTSSDPVIVGSYYVQNSAPNVLTPTNFTQSRRPRDYTYNTPRAVIQGSYLDSCRKSIVWHSDVNKCAFHIVANGTTFTVPGTPVPSDANLALVHVTGKYVTIQDLEIRNSAGRGIDTDSVPHGWCLNHVNNANSTNCDAYITMQRLYVHNSATTSMLIGSVARGVMRYNHVTHDNLSYIDALPGQGTDWRNGANIAVAGCAPCEILIEGNDVYWGYGELIGAYNISHVLMRGNEGGSGTQAGYDSGTSSDVIQEQNLIVGGPMDPNDPGMLLGGTPGEMFWTFGYELGAGGSGNPPFYAGMTVGAKLLRRNNLAANQAGACLHEYTLSSTATNVKITTQDLGNFCYQALAGDYGPSYPLYTPTAGALPPTVAAAGDIVNKNNLYVSTNASCNPQTYLAATVAYDYNLWSVLQTSSQCRGAHDAVGATGITSSYDFANAAITHMPDPLDFKPTGGVGLNAGTPLTSVVVDNSTNWDWVLSQRLWLPACAADKNQTPKADWVRALDRDFCGVKRNATTPDIGPFEHN